jgi:phospholipid/cholesterol/gamma-HCH transport system substrate-binding protein
MKLTIRYADQIVGSLIILAVGILVFAIFMLGSNQRWFSRDYEFITYFPSATGLSQNMPVQYKGFNIGRVKSIDLLKDDRVEVRFVIFDTHIDRVRQGSQVELIISPIGALGGNQFLFHPGKGEKRLDEGVIISAINANEGTDDIGRIISRVGDILATLDGALKGTGEETSLGQTMKDVQASVAGLQAIIGQISGDIDPILSDIGNVTSMLSNPDGPVASILDSEGTVYRDLAASLESISATLRNLEKTTDFVPAQLPQLAAMINELQTALVTAEDVLISLTNNPLLKGGIPERKETPTGGSYTRDLEF